MPKAINTISADLDIRLNDTNVMRKERAHSFTHRTSLSPVSSRLTQSQVYSKHPRQQPFPRPKPIPEDEPATFHIEDEIRLESTRTSIQSGRSNKSKRSNKSTRSSRAAHSNRGFHHEAGDDLQDSARSSATDFDRTSSRNTSINSRLTVTREQYWCFSKWTPCEKKLGVSVAVLLTLIFILVIIIGVLAAQDDSVEK